jgi:isopentenyl-diphosphate delta-isomerase
MMSEQLDVFEKRKAEHITQALSFSNQATGKSGFDRIELVHDSLPELDFDGIDLSTAGIKQTLETPYFIAAMSAGIAQAHELNLIFAERCAQRGWMLGVGSQRRQLQVQGDDPWIVIKNRFPQLQLIANLGIAQVIETPTVQIKKLVEETGAVALAVHLNPLQEALQLEGTPRFSGALARLAELTENLGLPIVIKETGSGISQTTFEKLSKFSNLFAVDVSGLGGTHWGRIEGARAGQAQSSAWQVEAAKIFGNWGVSTVDSLLLARQYLNLKQELWASGGIRSGLDAAKAIALGATRVGFAQPALIAALESSEALDRWMQLQEQTLKVALFCVGIKSVIALKGNAKAWKHESR